MIKASKSQLHLLILLILLLAGQTDLNGQGNRLQAQDFSPTGFEPATSNYEWERRFPNGLSQEFNGVEMLLVPAGCFMMGTDSVAVDYASPVHEICFDAPFWIDRYEVTNEQYGSASEESACAEYSFAPDQPRNCVTWFEARDHCRGREARLPSEAEWAYAARGPWSIDFPWGNHLTADRMSLTLAWSENTNDQPASVGNYPTGASWVGAMDMSGNVQEWVNTIYAIDYEEPTRITKGFIYPYNANDGREEDSDELIYNRVVRSSSWRATNMFEAHYAYRDGFPPDYANHFTGFRCARSYTEADAALVEAASAAYQPTPIPEAAIGFEPVQTNADWQQQYPEGLSQIIDGVEMVLVPAGCFMLGSEDLEHNAFPAHEFCFTEPFWIDRYEVTNEQYDTNCPDISSRPNQPQACISWRDALAHCESRGARLPTEAEWEYAAKGPDNLLYPWGNEWNGQNLAWNETEPDGLPDVGTYPSGASWVGAMDMSGSVWEWTSSRSWVYPYDPNDGRESMDETREEGVERGGGWGVLWTAFYQSSMRSGDSSPYDRGLRCARSYEHP